MSAVLQRSTPIEQRRVTLYLWSKGLRPAEIHRDMSESYGVNAMSCQSVAYWWKRFYAGCTQVVDAERSGRPCTSKNGANISAVDAMFQEDRRVHIRRIARK